MIYKYLTAVACTFALSIALAFAQNSSSPSDSSLTVKSIDLEGISGIQAGDVFRIAYEQSDDCSVEWEVNSDLQDYVEIYAKGGILYFEFNRKGLPYELQKKYRQKDNKLVLNAIVSVPSLRSITVTDNVVLTSYEGSSVRADSLTVTVSGNADYRDLAVNGSYVTVDASNKADVSIPVSADEVVLISSNTANLSASVNCKALTVTGRNSSMLKAAGKAEKTTVNGQGREIDLLSLTVPEMEVILSNGCRAYVNAGTLLSLDLKGGSLASFSGDPAIEIVSIQNSSVQHFTGEKKK